MQKYTGYIRNIFRFNNGVFKAFHGPDLVCIKTKIGSLESGRI